MPEITVDVRRIYEPVLPTDGTRVLVDRLWPRGVSREAAHLDEWMKSLAPSTELRKWYGHVPERFPEFERRYLTELEGAEQVAALDRLRSIAVHGRLTLLTATKDPTTSEAAVIAQVLRGGR